MSYIESHQELGRHPKTKRLARLLGVSLPCAVGHLQFLWWWAMDYAQDGDLSRFDAFDLADAAAYEGDAEQFLAALVGCGIGDGAGFVERRTDGSLHLHDWADYGGKLFEERRKNAQKQARYRDQKATQTEQSTPSAPPTLPEKSRTGNVTVTSPVTLKERRGEKRREEMPSASSARTREDDDPPPGRLFDPSQPLPVAVENFLTHTPNPNLWRERLVTALMGRELQCLDRYALALLREWKNTGGPPTPRRQGGRPDPATLYETQQSEIRQQLAELAAGGRS